MGRGVGGQLRLFDRFHDSLGDKRDFGAKHAFRACACAQALEEVFRRVALAFGQGRRRLKHRLGVATMNTQLAIYNACGRLRAVHDGVRRAVRARPATKWLRSRRLPSDSGRLNTALSSLMG
jgi:hypothetical protein